MFLFVIDFQFYAENPLNINRQGFRYDYKNNMIHTLLLWKSFHAENFYDQLASNVSHLYMVVRH